MGPRETDEHAAVDNRSVAGTVLGQDGRSCQEPTWAARGIVEDATAMLAPARRPTVISSVPGTEYRATSPVNLRSRLGSSPREVDAPRRGRRGR